VRNRSLVHDGEGGDEDGEGDGGDTDKVKEKR
jgi:hypothetical protein